MVFPVSFKEISAEFCDDHESMYPSNKRYIKREEALAYSFLKIALNKEVAQYILQKVILMTRCKELDPLRPATSWTLTYYKPQLTDWRSDLIYERIKAKIALFEAEESLRAEITLGLSGINKEVTLESVSYVRYIDNTYIYNLKCNEARRYWRIGDSSGERSWGGEFMNEEEFDIE
ncbi:TPA_asm: P8 [Trifolium betacytorhabdovirus 1]|nr:TPA_asm: P8 [Trifolium betacytorhabdovirus 1]